ncbi:MAG: flagellar basal body P-ring formation chaperone FlgA [Rhodobacteraceae bacterium]|nr:flagellar basal body P-ring formation chaperone FlgA [Paracoccaceae bacterium]
MRALVVFLALLAGPSFGQSVVALSGIRAQSVITVEMVALAEGNIPGAYVALAAVIGLEARINIYPGRPIMIDALGAPAILQRNQSVVMRFRRGALTIYSEGRVLDRAGIGDRVRVMNMDSKSVIFGRVGADGTIEVGL